MDIWNTCESVERDPAKVSGAWVFRDTRIRRKLVEHGFLEIQEFR